MGFGDEILATGMARGAKERGKRIAFGDGKKIIFSPWSEQVFRYNPNVAHPGDEAGSDIEWIAHHKGHRLYNSVAPGGDRWAWNLDFRPVPGEVFLTDDELAFAETAGSGFVVIEPNVPWHKTVAPNKDWGAAKYEAVALELVNEGLDVVQFFYENQRSRARSARMFKAPTFRHALAVLSRAALYIGPEGGLHHGAAADKRRASDGSVAAGPTPAVVLFGGFIPPSVTGYPMHTNLTGGATACGKIQKCRHCRDAMDAISVDEAVTAARKLLSPDLAIRAHAL